MPLGNRAAKGVLFASFALLGLSVALLALDAAAPLDLARLRRSSPVVLDKDGAWLRALPVEGGRWRVRADLSRLDPVFVRRLLSIEDARFYSHNGVDPLAVFRAGLGNWRAGRVLSGGSTLSMQTARMLAPQKRTLLAKAFEALTALRLELHFSKAQILEFYLTLTPYGGNLEGVRAASLSYFGHEPSNLTLSEQALLIALPQAPEARRPDRRPRAASAARQAVLEKLAAAGQIRAQDAAEANRDPLPVGRTPFPTLAWALTGRLARGAPAQTATVATELDAGLQKRLEALARRTAEAQGPNSSAAILVVELEGRRVRADVGSAGRDRPGGWVDMTEALRSPGSALKPFVYGFAFDQGLAAPETVFDDAPTRFGDYQPENFDHAFHGKVTARQALQHSFNIPAVAVMAKLGPDVFQARLESAGVRLVRPKVQLKDAGLALALGGAGITLEDLTTLYAALGDKGQALPLNFTQGQTLARAHATPTRLLAPEAADQVMAILEETPPPEGRPPGALLQRAPKIAYKTGTSYGFRDALAAGVGGGYAVVVWTGRPDGGARGGLTGRDASAPLLFDVFDALAAPVQAARPIEARQAPPALQTLRGETGGPVLVFPPDGAMAQVERFGPKSRGLSFAARGEGLSWYVDGAPLKPDPDTGAVIFHPKGPGFYAVRVIDAQGREAKARLRVRGGQ